MISTTRWQKMNSVKDLCNLVRKVGRGLHVRWETNWNKWKGKGIFWFGGIIPLFWTTVIFYLLSSQYMKMQFITEMKKMKAKGKENIDVQSLVERPHIYILGRCGTSKVEQLAYIKTRKAWLQRLSEPVLTSNGVQITDMMHGGPTTRIWSWRTKRWKRWMSELQWGS